MIVVPVTKEQYPTADGGPGKEETYWLKTKLNASIRHLRDIEDYYRTMVGEYHEGSFYDVRATRARQLYEAAYPRSGEEQK